MTTEQRLAPRLQSMSLHSFVEAVETDLQSGEDYAVLAADLAEALHRIALLSLRAKAVA